VGHYGSVLGWTTLALGGGAEMWTLPGYGYHLERDNPDLRKQMAAMGGPEGFEDVVASINPIPDDQPDTPAHWSVTFAVDDADSHPRTRTSPARRTLGSARPRGDRREPTACARSDTRQVPNVSRVVRTAALLRNRNVCPVAGRCDPALREDVRVTITGARRLAVLIDSDNTTASLTTELLEEIAKYGTPTIKRAYGDWTTQHLVGWKEELLRHAIQPVQQFAYTSGKNSTDSALIIDAMDLLYAGNLEGFVIVSSDSDFTRLATRLRESGMTVYGLGRRNTPAPFVAACDRFI
jgi:uncharacterized LabA/DUF88 family protein